MRVVAHRTWSGDEPPRIVGMWSGTTLTLGVAPDPSAGVSFEVHVPPAVAVTLESAAGSVTVAGLRGDARLTSAAGAVTARALATDVVDASSRSGAVDLDLVVPPTRVVARTAAGAVRVAVPATAAYRVDAATNAGRRVVEVPTDPAAARTITAHTSAGPVTVTRR